MKTISKILVSLGVLMGSMGFVANAQGPGPAPGGPKGGPMHNTPPPPPPPQPGKNYPKNGPNNRQQNGRRYEMQNRNKPHECKDCIHLSDIFGFLFYCTNHNHLHR